MLHALLREIDALEADLAKAAKRPIGVPYEQPPGSGRWYEVRQVGNRRKRVRVPAPHREVEVKAGEDWDPAPRTRAERAADDPDATVIRPRRQVGGMSDAWDAAGRPGDPDWDGPDGDTHFDIKTTWHRPLSRQQKWHDYVVDVVDAMEDHLRSHLPRRVQRWLERFDERPMSKGLRRALWDLAVLEAELAKGRQHHGEGEEWTRPSGQRVRKVNGKVVNVPKDGGRRAPAEGSDATDRVRELLGSIFDRMEDEDEDQEWRYVYGELDPRERRDVLAHLAGLEAGPPQRGAARSMLRSLTEAGVTLTRKPAKRSRRG